VVKAGNIGGVEIMDGFEKDLVKFVEDSGYAEKNYMISPTSFRAALTLAVAGADTQTKDELINAMGFKDEEEMNAWYHSVEASVKYFDEYYADSKKQFEQEKEYYGEDAVAPEGQFTMLNSVWNNSSINGKFTKDYIKYVNKNYGAVAKNVSEDKITDEVNSWVKEGTNGMIPYISTDLSDAKAVLVNTIYLKSAWENSFEDYLTSEDDFTTASGETVKKDFMYQTEYFKFYEDNKGKLIVLPLKGGVDAIFILGQIDDVEEALDKAVSKEVNVKLPKLDLESSFGKDQLIEYLKSKGAVLAFDENGNADFSKMSKDNQLYIADILQKSHIKMEEEGIEAAAATAIIMCESCCEQVEEPKQFYADEPFKFMLCTGESDSEVLFYGQIVE
jgi:serpin B